MAKIEDIVLNASENYAKAIGISVDQLIDHVLDLYRLGYSKDEVFEILSQIDIQDTFFKTAKVGAAVDELMGSYGSILDATELTGNVSEKFLDSFIRTEKASWIAYANGQAHDIRRRLMIHVMTGSTRKQMAYDLLRSGVFTDREIRAHINTSLMNFSRSVTRKMSESHSPDRLYYYLGPMDEKTRPICLEMLSEGAIPLSEVESRYPGAMDDGGGVNCRHKWTASTDITKTESKQNAAVNRIAFLKRKKKWPSKVQTLQQYLEARGD